MNDRHETAPDEPMPGAATEVAGPGTITGTDELRRGDLIGRYVVISLLGRGGMGVVYAAYDPELDRKIALKLLLARPTDEARVRMLREGQAMAQLAHPNVVAVHDVGTVGDRVFIAMEFVDGQTLAQWSAERPRGWREVVETFLQAGEGLKRAHAVGLIHRDFKPDNVLVGGDGRVRVTDFGLARAEHPAAPPGDRALAVGREHGSLDVVVTAVGSLVGTPRFMAPEQWAGAVADARTDQFSFCVALWSALYGAQPFDGPSVPELAMAVTGGQLATPPRGHAVPGWLHRVLIRGLSREPERRFPSMDALLRAIVRGRARAELRTRWISLGVLVAAALGVFGWQQVDRSRRETACDAAGRDIYRVWNDEASVALHAALTATGVGYAATTHTRALPWLDRWTAQWADARTRVCREANVERTRPPELAGPALACLDERRDELVALLAVLGEADASVVPAVVPAVAGLTAIAPCSDGVALARRPALPADLSDRDRVRTLRRDLTRIQGLAAAGRYREAQRLAQALLGGALVVGHAPLIAEARVAAARMSAEVGEIGAAERGLVRAYIDAGILGADETAATAAVELVRVVGYLAQRQHDGLQWSLSAEMLVGRLGQSQQILGGNLRNNIGILHATSGGQAEALAAFEQALEIRREALGPEHPLLGDSLSNLGELYRYASDLDRAEALGRQALAQREAGLGPDHPDTAASLNNLAATLQDRGDHAVALPLLERALTIWERALGPGHPNVGHVLTNIGHAHAGRGDRAMAVVYLERALAVWEKATGREHPNYAIALNSLALVRFEQHDPGARALFEQVLALQRRAWGAAANPDIALTLSYLAEAYAAEGDRAQARRLHEQALAMWQQTGGLDQQRATHTWIGLANLLVAEGRAGEALPLLERALEIDEKAGIRPRSLAKAWFALARALRRAPPPDRDEARAVALATRAADAYRAAGDAERLAAVEAWLRETE